MQEEQNFETNINNAKKLLEKLNSNDISLKESIQLYKEGIKELEDATKLLEEAKLVFEKMSK